ncbi:MAG TPA: hypothetical protein VL068_02795 [Microthrixaceae bacterium]|nr:hypothetical protein [Microthrixaceae bacterium]
MDTVLTSGEVASELGVSAPTLRRSAARLGLFDQRRRGQHRLFSANDVQKLIDDLGKTPEVRDFTPYEVMALAAFARRPIGFRSIRAVARSARIAPTTASGVIKALVQRGFVRASTETVAEGSARDITVYRLQPSAKWAKIASVVSQTVPPRTEDLTPPPSKVPPKLWHHFWNVEPSRLSLPDDEQFIARRLLLSQDPIAWAWAAQNLSPAAVSSTRYTRGIDGPTCAMIDNLLAEST